MIKLNLHVLLAEYRISQKDLSDMTGIRPPTISAYCSNTFKHIVTSHLDKICYVLNCSPKDIIIYENTVPEGIDEEKRKEVFDKAYKNTPKYMIRADNGEIEWLGEPISEYSVDAPSQNNYKFVNDSNYSRTLDERLSKIELNLKSQMDEWLCEKLKDVAFPPKDSTQYHSNNKDKDKK